jgi:hydrogenase nickel incorporation protein HypA/HybF
MHERSLAKKILQQVEEILEEYPGQRILSVELEVGPMSGVEPDLLLSALAEPVVSKLEGISFSITEVPLRAACELCHTEFVVNDFLFRCSQCSSADVIITQGDSVRILNAVMTVETGS